MRFDRFNWIRTRDGSPTLWHNDEGAAFRSQKGAFTESLNVFVKPALESLRARATPSKPEARLVEFGLGPGTNWALWTLSLLAARKKGASALKASYTAIERDTESFRLGYESWRENVALLTRFVAAEWDEELDDAEALAALAEAHERIVVVPSLEALKRDFERQAPPASADLWFHDPFGFDVNPSAYQVDELSKIRALMAPESRGFSYACNSPFQKALHASGFDVETPESGESGLKRQRLEFWPALG